MSVERIQAQPAVQAGPSGKTAGVGPEVGVLHSSGQASVMEAERRRGTCSGVNRGTWPKAPQGDKPRGRKVPDIDCGCGGNAPVEPNSESRIRESRPSGLMRGRNRRSRTNNCGRFNLFHPVPAYSTTELYFTGGTRGECRTPVAAINAHRRRPRQMWGKL